MPLTHYRGEEKGNQILHC